MQYQPLNNYYTQSYLCQNPCCLPSLALTTASVRQNGHHHLRAPELREALNALQHAADGAEGPQGRDPRLHGMLGSGQGEDGGEGAVLYQQAAQVVAFQGQAGDAGQRDLRVTAAYLAHTSTNLQKMWYV